MRQALQLALQQDTGIFLYKLNIGTGTISQITFTWKTWLEENIIDEYTELTKEVSSGAF